MTLLFADFELDPVSGELRRDGRPVALQAKLHAILLHLVQNRDRWVTKSQLLAHVWPGVAVSDATIGGTISDLRAALGDTGRKQRLIQTLRGRGYRFVAPVEEKALPAAPSPAPSSAAASSSFVGRDDVMAELEAALASALAGEGRMILLAGEAGIGKTRTAREIVARARARGIPAYTGACSETGGAPAAWAWRQLLRGLVADREVEMLRSELGPRATRVAQIVPELRERLPDLPPLPRETPEAARFELFDATVSFLRRVAEAKGLVLHLDDLHTSDEGTLGLLEFLAGDIAESRILLVAGHRDAEADCSHAFRLFLADTARLPGQSRIALRGLAHDAGRAIVELVLRTEPPASLVDAVMQRTDGNPFLIRELVTYVARRPDGSLDGVAQCAVPDRIRETTRARLAGLAPASRTVVECAAVIGREFDLDFLARVVGQASSGIRAAIEEAHRHELVLEPEEGRSRFVHVLLRDAVYRAQPAARRAETHRRVGEALESMQGADPDDLVAELAHHFALAAPDCNRKAIDYAMRAGQRARDAFGYDDAASHFERALALLDHESTATAIERCDLLLDLGRARMRESRRGEQRDAFRRAARLARSLGDAERLAEAARGFTYRTLIGIADVEGVELVVEALAAMPPTDDRRRIYLLAFLAHLLQSVGRIERSDACLAEASERAERLGDPGASADFARLAAHVEIARGSPPERILELALRANRLARLAADGTQAAPWVATSALLPLGDRTAADAVVATAESEARRDWFELFRVSQYRVMHRLAAGELAEAETPIAACVEQERLRRGTTGLREGSMTLAQLYALRREQDRLSELAESVLRATGTESDAFARTVRMDLLIEVGRRDEAHGEYDRFAAEGFAVPPADVPACLALLSEVCGELGDAAGADRLVEQLLPHRAHHAMLGGVALSLGPITRHLGLLHALCERFDQAEQCFADARARSRAMGWTLWERYAELDEAKLRLRRRGPGDRERGRELASGVLADAQRRGLVRLARLAEAALAGSEGRSRLRAV
jgi:DNA-binding winged helix-turn-helix (wHTH) protein/tetratricopeptide (TPR) repeat protein